MNQEVGRFNSLVNETRLMSGDNDDDSMTRVEILYKSVAAMNEFEKSLSKVVCFWTSQFLMSVRHGVPPHTEVTISVYVSNGSPKAVTNCIRDMLQIFPNLPGQKFIDPPFKEEIISFIKRLGYSGNMKSLSDAKVKTLPKPWRTFRTIINKCLSGKVTGNDLLRLSQAQILWGMYYQKNVDYVYLLWEDLVYQIENKEAKKNKDMYYPRFTKVIINHFISKDQSIPRRNKVDWHMANDDPILNTMRSSPSMKLFKNTMPYFLIR
nr:hypothetical protein [Tanacetum cinerariifolium]